MKLQCETEPRSAVMEILQSFYIQIGMQPIEFTAAGYYTINLNFLAGILTGIASYQSDKN
jgi:hypothetical protein